MVDIAGERIGLLFKEADKAALRGRIDLADRYIELARAVGMRYNVTVPASMRRRACRGCHGYLLPGATSRTRLNRGRVTITCLRCGHVTRVPLGPPRVPKAWGAAGGGRAKGRADADGRAGKAAKAVKEG
jgi:ribonuclease P protein subunit RPR2